MFHFILFIFMFKYIFLFCFKFYIMLVANFLFLENRSLSYPYCVYIHTKYFYELNEF